MEPSVNIVIPTYNRSHLVERAVSAALSQSYHKLMVTVIDDASTDTTEAVLEPYFSRENFLYLRLTSNLGTARAKNVALALTNTDAYTFHDSDDIPHRDKLLRQSRILARKGIEADNCLNWRLAGRQPETLIDIGCVLTHHELLLPDGARVEIGRSLSLVDDFFPNLQMGATVPGDWTHVNSGLFRATVFARLGGFADCIEEDREFRNRIIMAGEVVWVLPEPLLTKIETPDSLTQSQESAYESARRQADREEVWRRVNAWRETGGIEPVPLDLSDAEIAFVSNPALLGRSPALATAATRKWADGVRRRFVGAIDAVPVEMAS